MRRRAYLETVGAVVGSAATAATAGCLAAGRGRYEPPAPVEDPPEGVYRPRATSRLCVVGIADAGPFRLALMYGYPVRFWEVVGEQTYLRDAERDDDVHLVALAWDPETGVVFPEVGLTVEVARDGDLVAHEAVYAMVSQGMGFHYGDNVALDGDGRYDVTVAVGGLQLRRVGAFADRFGEPASHAFAFEYARRERDSLATVRADAPGTRGALPAVASARVPTATAPVGDEATTPAEEHATVAGEYETAPGEVLGRARSSDVGFEIRAVPDRDRATTLVVHAFTPFNHLLLPNMGLRAFIERDGAEDATTILQRTLGPNLGYHYATPVSGLADATGVQIETLTPPQVARHEGYETAFLDVDDVRVAFD